MARARTIAGLALAASLPVYVWWFGGQGLRHQLVEGQAPSLVYILAALVMVLLAAGGLVFGLTSVIPGRENDARVGRRIFGLGVGVATALFFFQWFAGSTALVEGVRSSLHCAAGALWLALPAGIIVGGYVLRGLARSLPAALAAAFTGGMGLAAVMVHLTCPHPDPLHMVLGHALAPLYGGVASIALTSVFAALGIGPGSTTSPG
jgi:hypothetical protein